MKTSKNKSFLKWMFSTWKTWVVLSVVLLIGIVSCLQQVWSVFFFMLAVAAVLFVGDYVYWKKNVKDNPHGET